MNLLLITKTKMIIKIFDLICTKLDIKLGVQDNTEVSGKYNFVVVDQDLIDDRFNIVKQFSNKIGAISNEELPFDKSRDFLIPRPFLPHDLLAILEEQIGLMKEEKRLEDLEKESSNHYNEDAEDLTVFVESLADDIAEDIEDDNDESIITIAALKDGGVLDKSELGKINSILEEDNIQSEILKQFQDEDEMDENDWKDLSDIIDDALDEVNDYEFDVNYEEPVKLILSNHNIEELKPLLSKFNQSVIDKLSQGQTIDLKLSLKA